MIDKVESKVSAVHPFDALNDRASSLQTARLNDTRLSLPGEGRNQLQYRPPSPFVSPWARIEICTVPRGAISKLGDPFTLLTLLSPSPRPPFLGVRFNGPSGRGGRGTFANNV